MPLLFLHIDDAGEMIEDQEGQDFPDLAAAHEAGVDAARWSMAEGIREGRLSLASSIVIADETGCEMERVRFASAISITGMELLTK